MRDAAQGTIRRDDALLALAVLGGPVVAMGVALAGPDALDIVGRLALLAFPVLGFAVAVRRLARADGAATLAWAGLVLALLLLLLPALSVNAVPTAPPAGLAHMACDRVSLLPQTVGLAVRALDQVLPLQFIGGALLVAGLAFTARPVTRVPGAWTAVAAVSTFLAFVTSHLVSGCPSI